MADPGGHGTDGGDSGYVLTDFKPGDRVEFVGNHKAAVDLGYTGLTGSVTWVDSYAVTVQFDDREPVIGCSAKYLAPYVDVDVSDPAAIEDFLNT